MNFKDLSEDIIGYANQTFAETYEKIFRNYWHDNRFIAASACNYNVNDPKNSRYQATFPTMNSPEGTQYSNIIIKIVPSIDQQQAKALAEALHRSASKPAGNIDSELIVIVALQRRGWTHGFKHIKSDKGGYLTSIFVAGDKGITSANELWRKLLDKVVIPFYECRLHKFMQSFNLVKNEYVKGARAALDKNNNAVALTNIYYRNSTIIDGIDMTKGLFIKSMSHFSNWLHVKLGWFAEQFKAQMITRQIEKKALSHCTPIPLKLRMQSKRDLIAKLQRSLDADVALARTLAANRYLSEKELSREEVIEEHLLFNRKIPKVPLEVVCHD